MTLGRLLLVLIITACTSACASYHAASWRGTDPEEGTDVRSEAVEIGTWVQVVLRSREVVSGRVVALDAESITVEGPGVLGARRTTTIPSSRIESVRVKGGTSWGTTLAVAAVVGVAVTIWFVLTAPGFASSPVD